MDYLLVGHVARDLSAQGPRLGGTAAFSALTAQALGMKVAVVTSAPDELRGLMAPLGGLAVHCLSSASATTFENTYTSAGRSQRITGRAASLCFDDIPMAWRRPAIVHLAPIADEVDPMLARCFPASFVGVTPQGWMRQWDQQGLVSFKTWSNAPSVLPYANAVVISLEDVGSDENLIADLARQTATLVVTRGKQGCTVYVNGAPSLIPAPSVEEVDPTGAGDIFAASFFAHLYITGDALSAARDACAIAADSVTRRGLAGVPERRRFFPDS